MHFLQPLHFQILNGHTEKIGTLKEKWGGKMKANKIMQEQYIKIAITEGRLSQVLKTGSIHTKLQCR